MHTLGHFLDEACSRAPQAEALAYAPSNRVVERLTWAELQQASRQAAAKLIALGVGKGTRVGLLCPNRTDWLPLAFGAFRIGAVLVPLSTLWKRDEIAYGLRHADVHLLLTVARFLKHDYLASLYDVVPELQHSAPGELYDRELPCLRRVVVIDDSASAPPGTELWRELASRTDESFVAALEATIAPVDLATVFFTSGTTAQAKAVVHCHGALVSSAQRLAPCLGITPEDSWWGHMPLFWSGGFVLGALATMAGGGRIVLQETVTPAAAFELLASERCTLMAGWHQAGPLLDLPDVALDRLALRKGTYHALAHRLLGADHHAVGVYGMSETATCVTATHWRDPEPIRTGTFGKPLSGSEIRIVDPETRALRAPGESGEIEVKGPTLMEGYLKVPRAQTFDAEGFFRTGDLGYLDEQGYLHFATRLKDVIKTAGVNVAAAEVEAALLRHPSVKAAHVVGVPDEVRGENIAAFVVAGDGVSVSADELREACRRDLASYKIPRHFLLVSDDEVPRTGSGKVEKVALRRRAVELLGNRDSQ